jgi:hypothetical protein
VLKSIVKYDNFSTQPLDSNQRCFTPPLSDYNDSLREFPCNLYWFIPAC